MTLRVRSSINPDRATISLSDGPSAEWEIRGAEFSSNHANFALLAALPAAMRAGTPLYVEGIVDPDLLRNAELLSHYWAQWRPKAYRPVQIQAAELLTKKSTSTDHVICLSGGVDSTFALLRSLQEPRPKLKRKLALGFFVHGFDFGLNDDTGFDTVFGKIRRAVDPSGLQLATIRTDWKGGMASGSHWEAFHTIGLAAIMHMFSGSMAGGILASDYTFREDHDVAPWGSSAVTNRLLSSSGFSVIPVGEDSTRIEKIAALDQWGKLDTVSVCWEGARSGENCARCEKCLRTMLMFEALNIDPTAAFGRRPTPSEFRRLRLTSPAKRAFIRQALHAFDESTRGDLAKAARAALSRSEQRAIAKGLYDRIKRVASRGPMER